MADIGKAMSRFDVEALQEMLCFQEQLIEKLYNELDEESEASSTAATEALSMILRLQGEKAAEEMEAEQYKRFVEEKMSHAEESLCVLQELIDQKQMEIDELDYQAQDYRYKLVSMGYDDDIDDSELEYFEDLEGKLIVQSIGRCKSTPNIPLKDDNMKKDDLKDENISPKRDMNDVPMVGSISVYCEQIEKLEQRVKQIAGANNYAKLSSLPVSKRRSCNNFLEQFKETYLVQHRVNKSDNEAAASRSVSPPNVLDVFEVPRAIKDEDFVVRKEAERLVKDETDWHKKYLVPMQHLDICPTTSASETAEIRHVNRTVFEIAEVERKGTRQEPERHEEIMLLHDIKEQPNLAPKQHFEICPSTSASETEEIRCVNRTTFKIAEVERQGTRQEPDKHEELMMLHDIKEKLNLAPLKHLKVCPMTTDSETEEIHRVNRSTFKKSEVQRQGTRQEPNRHKELMLLHDRKEQLNLVPIKHLKNCPMTNASETADIRHVNKKFEIAEVERHGTRQVERHDTRQEPERNKELMLLHDRKEQLNLVPIRHLNNCPMTNASETAEVHRVNKKFEIAEVERDGTRKVERHGTRQETERHKEIMLLHDIKEQLNLLPMQNEDKLHRVGEATSPTTSVSETAEIHPVNRTTLEITEVDRQRMRQESNRHEQLTLLYEIKEQLNLMQSDIRTWKNIKSSPRDEPSIDSLTEVMACFWM